jgi:tetratricopeptide (TPR) repeat protein
LLNSIASWYQILGQDAAAIEKWQQAIDLTSQDPDGNDYISFVSSLAKLLQDKERYKDMFTLFAQLHNEVRFNGVSRLVAYMLDRSWDRPLDQLQQAARVEGRLEFAEQAFRAAIRAAKESKNIAAMLKYSLAVHYYQQMDEEGKAITLWKRVMSDSTLDSDWYFVKVAAVEELAQIYFTRALLARRAGVACESAVQALEDVAKPRPDVELDMKEYYTTYSTTLLLGSWYRLEGRDEEAKP